MGWAGFASGVDDALQRMLAERRAAFLQNEQLRLQQEAAARQDEQFKARMNLDRDQLGVQQMNTAADQAYRQGQVERQARADQAVASDRANAQGKRTMLGDYLTQRTPGKPLTDMERGTLEAMAVTDDIDLPASLLAKPQRRVVTTIGPRGGPLAKLVSDEELEQGVPEYRAPTGGGTPQQDWVIRGGKPTPIPKGTARPGDMPYDAVAARQSSPVNEEEAQDTAREIHRIAGALRNHKGLPGAFGVISSRLPTWRQDTADAEVLLKSLTGLLTLENTGKLKGVLSNADMEVLRRASTTLASEMGDAAARAELDRLITVMGKVIGKGGFEILSVEP